MSIYKQIAGNKFKTFIIFSIFIFLLTGFFYIVGRYYGGGQNLIFLGLSIALFSSFISYFFSHKIVLGISGAKKANREQFFDLYTVTENLSIAAGLPTPQIYVIPDSSPNAFATGRNPKHSVVCATTGLLQILDRSELEGVIAHELSHIKNYDILLMSVVAVLVGSIAIIADWVQWNMFWGGRRNNQTSKNPVFLVLFLAAIIITPIIATLIQLAISRRREFLADASAALITRYPDGLARALEKISSSTVPLKNATTSTAHLYISNPFRNKQDKRSWLAVWFSTHPPVEDRIKILRSM